MENVIVSYNIVESEAFQTFTELKKNDGKHVESKISNALLIKKRNGKLVVLDEFIATSTGTDDTLKGGLIGGLVGILGGPIGMLLGFSVGTFIGTFSDRGDIKKENSLLQSMVSRLENDDVAILLFAQEQHEKSLDDILTKFETTVMRYDAAVIAEEVEHAQEIQKDLEKQARQKLSSERSNERKSKIQAYKERFKGIFDREKTNK